MSHSSDLMSHSYGTWLIKSKKEGTKAKQTLKTKRDRGQKSCDVLCWSLSQTFQFGPRDLQIALLALPRVRLYLVIFHLLNSVWLLRCWDVERKRRCVCVRERGKTCERDIEREGELERESKRERTRDRERQRERERDTHTYRTRERECVCKYLCVSLSQSFLIS